LRFRAELPLDKITIRSGTNVIAKRDEKPTASVFVQQAVGTCGLLGLPKGKTGRKETTIMMREKNSAARPAIAPSSRIFRRSIQGWRNSFFLR